MTLLLLAMTLMAQALNPSLVQGAPEAALAEYGATQPLSYGQALEMTLENNPEIAGASAALEGARARLLTANATFDPVVSANVGYSYFSDQDVFAGVGAYQSEVFGPRFTTGIGGFLPTGTNWSVGWTTSRSQTRFQIEGVDGLEEEVNPFDTQLTASITQPLLEGHKTSYNLRALRDAQAGVSQSDLTHIETFQRVLADAASRYWQLYFQTQAVKIATESLALTEEERRIVIARIETGDMAELERSRVEAAVLQAKSELLEAQNARANAADLLLLLMGQELGQSLHLTTPPPSPGTQRLDPAYEIAEAEQNSPGLERSRLSVESAERAVKAAHHARLPELGATGRYAISGWEDQFDDAIGEMLDRDLRDWYLGLELSAPVGNRADRGRLEAERAALAKARADLASAEQLLRQRVLVQVRTMNAARLKLDLSEANLRAAEATLAAERARRNAFGALEKDVLQSLRDMSAAKAEVERAKTEFATTAIELDRLTGRSPGASSVR